MLFFNSLLLLTIATTQTTSGDTATIAALVGLSIGLVKVLELSLKWIFNKIKPNSNNNEDTIKVFYEDTTGILKELQEQGSKHGEALDEHLKDDKQVLSIMRDTAQCLKDVSHSQERIVLKLDRMDDRLDKIKDKITDQK